MKNAKLINSAYTRMSFGPGTYGIEVFKCGKGVVIREGEPQRMALTFRIEEVTLDEAKEMGNLSREFLLEKGFTSNAGYADQFTHYYKRNKWVRV